MVKHPGTIRLSDPEVRRQIWERDEGRCGFCGQPVPLERMDIDHRLPRAVGGSDHWDNLRPAHPRCNRGSGKRDVFDHRRRHPDAPRPPKGDTVAISLRVPQSVRDWLEQTAERDHRDLNKQVLHYLDQIRRSESESHTRPLRGAEGGGA